MDNMSTSGKITIKESIVFLWELLGVCSIILLLYLPNGNTIITTVLDSLNIETMKWGKIGYENIGLIALFLTVYFTSFKFLAKYNSTKLFSIMSSVLMVVTMITAILFIN